MKSVSNINTQDNYPTHVILIGIKFSITQLSLTIWCGDLTVHKLVQVQVHVHVLRKYTYIIINYIPWMIDMIHQKVHIFYALCHKCTHTCLIIHYMHTCTNT